MVLPLPIPNESGDTGIYLERLVGIEKKFLGGHVNIKILILQKSITFVKNDNRMRQYALVGRAFDGCCSPVQ